LSTKAKKPAVKKAPVKKVKSAPKAKPKPDLNLEKSEAPEKLEVRNEKPVSQAGELGVVPARIPGKEKYFESVGRRKTAVARVRLLTKKSSDQEPPEGRALIIIRSKFDSKVLDRPYYEYFKDQELANIVDSPFKKLKSLTRFKATVIVNGGGISGQAEAIRHGISRALTLFDINFAKKLKKAGYLTRDSRRTERKKPGLKKARKSPRWAKR